MKVNNEDIKAISEITNTVIYERTLAINSDDSEFKQRLAFSKGYYALLELINKGEIE